MAVSNRRPSLAGPVKVGNILELPEEIQREICSHCSQCELICLSLVCKRFHELAAAQLYRNFHIVFPDEDDPAYDSPIDGLAGGLDTFVTSEYNYAKHLRDLSLDTLSSGSKAETAYRPYLYGVSCGKFMNTLLLLTLRKAKSLDTFRWNIRVELSRPVYRALHGIQSLKQLHLRMQAGPSLYEPPPPLPYHTIPPINTISGPQWHNTFSPSMLSTAPGPALLSIPIAAGLPPGAITYGPPPVLTPPPSVYKPSLKSRSSKRQDTSKEPITIGGFKNLQSLSILDVDNLDMISEIQTCVRNSSSTLKKLKLSFSDGLAAQARKPCMDVVDLNESDEDDEFQVVPINSSYDDGSGPARAIRAQEERKFQESILGRIFDVESSLGKRILATTKDDANKKERGKESKDPGKEFITSIKKVSQRLLAGFHGTGDLPQAQQDVLDMIVNAAQKYVDAEESQTTALSNGGEKANESNEAAACQETGQSSTAQDSICLEDSANVPSDPQSSEAGLFNPTIAKLKDTEDVIKPEDIDVAAPEDQLVDEDYNNDSHELIKADSSSASTPLATPIGTGSTEGSLSKFTIDVPDQTRKALESLAIHRENETSFEFQHEWNVLEAEIADANESLTYESLAETDGIKRQINEYTRATRGIALDSLGIHLIPIKASVLGRAIDLQSLKKITLLNVGNQAPFWSLMAKENKIQPLSLRKIFTDNVSMPFLHLVSQLECVTELFMFERNTKYKPESFAPKTKVTLEQIRRFSLRKHMHTIKRLIIKNEADNSWDADVKTMHLICKRGKLLEELALIMGIRAIHAFLQYIPGLVKLHVLHILTFRSDDTCLSVLRETRKFIVDSVAHYPDLPLEWIALGDDERAQRILRKTEIPKTPKNDKGKRKEVAHSIDYTYPILSVNGWDEESESDDEDDDLPFALLKLDLIENINFYDIWGVKIFKKEILAACL